MEAGLGCTGSASSTAGVPGALGDRTLRCQQAQSLPALGMVSCTQSPTCRWFGDVQSITRCLLLPTSSQEVSRRTRWKTQHQHPGALRGLWACGARGCGFVLVSASTGHQPGQGRSLGSSPCHPLVVVTVSWDRDAREVRTAAVPSSHPSSCDTTALRKVQNTKSVQDVKRYVVYTAILQTHRERR